ncbi:MAG: hypothetical protein QXP31_10925 [Pyrobaculum sp.]
MRFELGILLNVASFLLMALSYPYVAAPLYVLSMALILWPREKKKEEKPPVEERREPLTPSDIKKRPAAVPEI